MLQWKRNVAMKTSLQHPFCGAESPCFHSVGTCCSVSVNSFLSPHATLFPSNMVREAALVTWSEGWQEWTQAGSSVTHTLSCMTDQEPSRAIKHCELGIFLDRFKFAGTAVISCLVQFPCSQYVTSSFSLALFWFGGGWVVCMSTDCLNINWSLVRNLESKIVSL